MLVISPTYREIITNIPPTYISILSSPTYFFHQHHFNVKIISHDLCDSIFQLNVENYDLESEFLKAGCTIYDRVIRKIDNPAIIQVCLYLINLESDLHLR